MYKNAFFILVSIAIFCSFCKKSDEPTNTQIAGDTAVIKYDETVTLNDHDLDIHFTKVTEGRCPCKVLCITAGWAEISLHITAGQADTTVSLYSDIEFNPPNVEYSNEVKFAGKTIKLTEVRPENCDDPKPEEYEIDIEIL